MHIKIPHNFKGRIEKSKKKKKKKSKRISKTHINFTNKNKFSSRK